MTDYAHAPHAAHPPSAWAPAQLLRLPGAWRKIQRAYAYHPLVRVVPLEGDPPSEYRVEYKVRTLAIDENGQLTYLSSAAVHVWLPPQFPHAPPVIRPMDQVFHPNFTMDWVHQDPPWGPNSSLVDLVKRVGQMLESQAYRPEANFNEAAMESVQAYPHLVPTDPAGNFAPEAGGDPLGRICRYGAETLDQLRHQFVGLCDGVLAGRPKTGPVEVRQFGRQMSL